jgi:hypothetical protein
MRLKNEMSNLYFAIPLNIQYEVRFCVICEWRTRDSHVMSGQLSEHVTRNVL